MATSAVYTLLEMSEHSSAMASDEEPTEGQFEIGGRKAWDLKLMVGHLSAGGDVDVVVETSPTGEDDDDTWTTLHTFPTQSSQGTTTEKGASVPAEHVSPGVMRARVSGVTGEAWVECTATSPFLDPSSATDQNLLSKEVREFDDGLTRLVERAEQDVIEHAIGTDRLGKLEADLRRPTSYSRIRRAIARQAEHLHRLYKLGRSSEGDSLRALDRAGELADGLDVLLGPLMGEAGYLVWRGR